jgi:hypothetical protein
LSQRATEFFVTEEKLTLFGNLLRIIHRRGHGGFCHTTEFFDTEATEFLPLRGIEEKGGNSDTEVIWIF